MSLFFLTFFLIYVGIHLYIFLKARATFPFGIITNVTTGAIMLFMIFAPVIVRLTERSGNECFARILAFVGYTWMGGVLIFFITGILYDVFRLTVYVSGIVSNRDFTYITSARRFYFFLCLTITLLVVIYGIFEARQIKIEYLILPTKKISSDIGKVRIVQISDVHLGLIIGKGRIKQIVNAINKAKPDILVSTGDLVDVQIDNIDSMAMLFRQVYTTYGKFAVTGNHEFHAGIDRALEFTKKAGFTILRGQAEAINGIITIAGVDDETVTGWRKGKNTSEEELCSNIYSSQFTVLLKHRPVPYTGSLCVYDLQLSGHTHKGQIFPFFLITRLFFKQYAGFYEVNNNSSLYVNRGTGTWGPPIRFLAPPEITVIDIVHKNNRLNKLTFLNIFS
jgi:predicted MPP superfamily phosphohydrolase